MASRSSVDESSMSIKKGNTSLLNLSRPSCLRPDACMDKTSRHVWMMRNRETEYSFIKIRLMILEILMFGH